LFLKPLATFGRFVRDVGYALAARNVGLVAAGVVCCAWLVMLAACGARIAVWGFLSDPWRLAG